MEQIRIMIPTDPIPAARPRFSGRHAYQPKRNRQFREAVQEAARAAMSSRPPMTGEVTAVIKLYRRYRPTTRIYGDADNHLKAIFDGLNQIAIEDDSQIVRCLVEKHTDRADPRAEIELTPAQERNDWQC